MSYFCILCTRRPATRCRQRYCRFCHKRYIKGRGHIPIPADHPFAIERERRICLLSERAARGESLFHQEQATDEHR